MAELGSLAGPTPQIPAVPPQASDTLSLTLTLHPKVQAHCGRLVENKTPVKTKPVHLDCLPSLALPHPPATVGRCLRSASADPCHQAPHLHTALASLLSCPSSAEVEGRVPSRHWKWDRTEGQGRNRFLTHRRGWVPEVSSRCQGQKPSLTRLNQTGEFMELEGPGVDFRHGWIQENIHHWLMLSWKLPALGWEGTGTPEAQTTAWKSRLISPTRYLPPQCLWPLPTVQLTLSTCLRMWISSCSEIRSRVRLAQ